MLLSVAILLCNTTLSITATINGSAVVFLVDLGSALSRLCKDMWEKCTELEHSLKESKETCGC